MQHEPPKSVFNDKVNITFPNHFLIKIVCRDQPNIDVQIAQTLESIASHDEWSSLASKQKKYRSISLKVYVDDREQLDNVYRALSALDFVLMTL